PSHSRPVRHLPSFPTRRSSDLAPVYMGTPGLASPMEAERHTQIGRTKTGLLLLLIGTLIRWIPYFLAGLLGGLLLLIGAILVILDRKSTRLNSSHQIISYAVFC